MINKILKLVVNTLIVNDKHFLPNRGNLTQPIQLQLSEKQKTFSQFFFVFLICILNFKHLPKKADPNSRCIPGNTGSKKYDYINV